MMVAFYVLALIAGMSNPVQAGATSALQRAIDRPVVVALVSALGILLLTGLGAAVLGEIGFEHVAALVPWWAWCSGVFGAIVVISQPIVGPRIGAGAYVALTVAASTVASVLIDNYAWLDFPIHQATPERIVGVVLMIAGVSLVAAF